MTQKRLTPSHPGEVLDEEFLKPLSLSQYRLAKGLRVPVRRINEIVLGSAPSPPTLRSALDASFATRLASGLTCKPDTILKSKHTDLVRSSSNKWKSFAEPVDARVAGPRNVEDVRS